MIVIIILIFTIEKIKIIIDYIMQYKVIKPKII